jgi:hypothetical protein
MPYIKVEDRELFDSDIKSLSENVMCEGDLNYIFTKLIHNRIEQHGKYYQVLNNLIGVLECCKLELYRQIVAPYENEKILENGDV